MKDGMKAGIAIAVLFSAACRMSLGQAVPAGVASISANPSAPASGSFLPTLDGVLHYAVTASEIFQYGYYNPGAVTSSTALSGNIAYNGKSTVRPFSLLFAGGVFLPNGSGQGGVTTFQDVAVSQGLVMHRWVFNVSDSLSYLPQSPTTGLSGIPGVGDLGSAPVTGPVTGPAGGVLTYSQNRVANTLSGSVERLLTKDMSISGVGSWSTLHFLDDSNGLAGLDDDQYSGVVAINRRLDARSSVSLDAVYSEFTYGASTSTSPEPNFQTRGLNVQYTRSLSRAMVVSASVGPQWVSSSNSALIPPSTDLAVSASMSYMRGYTNMAVSYTRGVNSGSGVLPGALSNSIMGSVARTYGRVWVVSLDAGYTHTSGLTELFLGDVAFPLNQNYNTVYGGAQVTRGFTRTLSGYASYTVQNQSSNTDLNLENAFSGTSQTIGIGVTWSPRSTRLGQF